MILAAVVLVICFGFSVSSEKIEGRCPEGRPPSPGSSADTVTIFDDLTEWEMMKIVNYTKEIKCFNVRDNCDGPSANNSYIYLIELRPPRKADALSFLEKRGPVPGRYARLVLYRSELKEPVIEEYEIGPLPLPSTYREITRPHWRSPIPYSVRSMSTDTNSDAWKEFICRQLTKVENILRDVTGYTYSTDCVDRCLTYSISTPGRTTNESRAMWITLERRVESSSGSSLYPVGFEFLIDVTSARPCDWRVDRVWFRTENFANMEDLIDSYYRDQNLKTKLAGDSSPSNAAAGPSVAGVSSTSRVDSSSTTTTTTQRGPRCYPPDGRRFTVRGRHIRWLNWSFQFNIRTSTGPQLNDVRFADRRIVYELGLQELVTLNSGFSPASMFATAIQSVHLIGSRAYELYPGLDCPRDGSYYLDFVHYVHDRPTKYRRAACVFEESRDQPLRRQRHRYYNMSSTDRARGLVDYSLVVRTIVVIGQFDYIIDYVFHQNAVLETVCSVSGYVGSHYYHPSLGENKYTYGYKIAEDSIAYVYQHLANFKVDLDVYGQTNRLQTLTIAAKMIQNGTVWVRPFETETRKNESKAMFLPGTVEDKYLLIINLNATNKHGYPRAYRIVPITSYKNLLPESWFITRAIKWANYQVAVTARKDEEDTSSTIYNAMDQYNPVLYFKKYWDDYDSIEDQDVVAWVTLGTSVIPHSEDVPILQTTGSRMSFVLQPFNYFDSDPSEMSVDSVRVTVDPTSDRLIYTRSGDKSDREADCVPIMVRKSSAARVAAHVDFIVLYNSLLLLTRTFFRRTY